ncbi:hypothetical protein CURTO8I2_170173 [Curtobacterium sp. 8I-2]|nr:hypothetical protein CURTO8I2_170173 [Curtobacterium sp. 8I-2]
MDARAVVGAGVVRDAWRHPVTAGGQLGGHGLGERRAGAPDRSLNTP